MRRDGGLQAGWSAGSRWGPGRSAWRSACSSSAPSTRTRSPATGVLLPLAIAASVGVILFALALGSARPAVGVAAGAFAGWVGLTIAAALVGTPYGFGRMEGDAGRMSALVMHFSTTWHPTDAADPHLAPEYPPLYPMVDRAGRRHDRPSGLDAARPAEAVVTSFAVLAAFLLWRRLTRTSGRSWRAPQCSSRWPTRARPTRSWRSPSSCRLLGTFAVPRPAVRPTTMPASDRQPGMPVASRRTAGRRRRLHPVLGGVIIGLLVPWSPNMLFLSVFGVAAVIGLRLWRAADRRRQLVDLAITAGVGFVVASWYLVPLAIAYAGSNVEVVADTWLSGSLVDAPFNVIGSPSAADDAAPGDRPARHPGLPAPHVVGAAVRASPRRRVAFRAAMELRFVIGGHSFMLLYVAAQLRYVLCVAGILTCAELGGGPSHGWSPAMCPCGWSASSWRPSSWPRPRRPAGRTGRRRRAASWTPRHRRPPRRTTARPTRTPSRCRAAARCTIRRRTSCRGSRWTGSSRSSTPSLGPKRHAGHDQHQPAAVQLPALAQLAAGRPAVQQRADPVGLPPRAVEEASPRTPTPARWPRRCARCAFGPVDALVLKAGRQGWYFADIRFTPSAFSGPQFAVSGELPHGYYVVVRLPRTEGGERSELADVGEAEHEGHQHRLEAR